MYRAPIWDGNGPLTRHKSGSIPERYATVRSSGERSRLQIDWGTVRFRGGSPRPVRPPARIPAFHVGEAGAAPARVTTVAFLQLARRPGSQPGNAGATPARDATSGCGVLVARQFWELDYAGSIPVARTIFRQRHRADWNPGPLPARFTPRARPVWEVQVFFGVWRRGSALGSGPRGRWFNPSRPDHLVRTPSSMVRALG